MKAPAPAVDKWGADGFIAKLPPAGVLTGIKILPYERGQRTRETVPLTTEMGKQASRVICEEIFVRFE